MVDSSCEAERDVEVATIQRTATFFPLEKTTPTNRTWWFDASTGTRTRRFGSKTNLIESFFFRSKTSRSKRPRDLIVQSGCDCSKQSKSSFLKQINFVHLFLIQIRTIIDTVRILSISVLRRRGSTFSCSRWLNDKNSFKNNWRENLFFSGFLWQQRKTDAQLINRSICLKEKKVAEFKKKKNMRKTRGRSRSMPYQNNIEGPTSRPIVLFCYDLFFPARSVEKQGSWLRSLQESLFVCRELFLSLTFFVIHQFSNLISLSRKVSFSFTAYRFLFFCPTFVSRFPYPGLFPSFLGFRGIL